VAIDVIFKSDRYDKGVKEVIKMKLKEGSCLSFLGLVSVDLETGAFSMNKLVAVLAGGMSEAKRCVKNELAKVK